MRKKRQSRHHGKCHSKDVKILVFSKPSSAFFYYPSSPPLFSHPNKNSSSFFPQLLSFLLFSLLFFSFSYFNFDHWALPSFKMFHCGVQNILYFCKSSYLSDHSMLLDHPLASTELRLFISFSFFPSKIISITQTIKKNCCKEMTIN